MKRRVSAETRAKIAAARRMQWTPEMDEALWAAVDEVGIKQAAARVGVVYSAARRRCDELGIVVAAQWGGAKPDVERTREILRLIDTTDAKSLAARLGITVGAVYKRVQRARRQGITA